MPDREGSCGSKTWHVLCSLSSVFVLAWAAPHKGRDLFSDLHRGARWALPSRELVQGIPNRSEENLSPTGIAGKRAVKGLS